MCSPLISHLHEAPTKDQASRTIGVLKPGGLAYSLLFLLLVNPTVLPAQNLLQQTNGLRSWALKTAPDWEPQHQKPTNIAEEDQRAIASHSVGYYTSLSGFYDYQINAGACQHVRIDPSNGNIHVIFMVSDDSTDIAGSRRTAYAFSSNGGVTWNNFGQVRVPSSRSGYPSLDLLQGTNSGIPVLANHVGFPESLATQVFRATSSSSGVFAQLNPAPLFGSDEPIWPSIAGVSDGSIVVRASRRSEQVNYVTRTSNFTSWSSWQALSTLPDASAGTQTSVANGSGRVMTVLNGSSGVYLVESTNNGVTWSQPSQIYLSPRIVGADTLQPSPGVDAVYDDQNQLVVMSERRVRVNDSTDGSQIVFWTQSTGFVVAATQAGTPGVVNELIRLQSFHSSSLGYPTIGLSGSTIVVVFMAFRPDTSAAGFNYGDIYYIQSTNGGSSWSVPTNITNTPFLDERYPSISKWNEPGKANITWQEDTQPGSAAVDNAPLSRVRQVFLKLNLITAPTSLSPNGVTVTSTNVTLTWSPIIGATSYGLQVSTDSSFSPLIVNQSGLAFASYMLNDLAYNTTYYWRVNTSNSGGTSAYSTASFTTTGTKSITSPGISYPANPTSSTDYRVVSCPGASSLSVSQVLSGAQNTDWRIFRENGSAIPNNLSELSSSSPLNVGEGYWLLKKGTFSFSRTTTMPQLSSDGTYTISVRNGWNIIGNPFDVSVPWSTIIKVNGLPSNQQLSGYTGSSGFQPVDVLEPFKGYYCNLNIASLKIPYPFPSLKLTPLSAPQIDWKVQLILETEINTDAQNHLGIAPSSKPDLDELDQPKPPLVFDQDFLYFSRPSWDSRYGLFNSDFRPSIGDGQVWDFEVSNPRKSACRVRFNGIEKIPAEYDVILLNERSTARVDLRERSTHEFQPVAEKTPFRLLVGKKPFVEEQVRTFIPREFELTQNYPNPFNPSTAITYKVPCDAVVRVEVLSMLGQRVAILAEGSHAPGVYTVTWNASDGTHGNASSGVYFCRFCVDGKPTRTIRMTLLR